jgi:hypothetical protein
MKSLIISPQAGFGNRLRALCSARVFGALTGRQVFHYWVRDDEKSHVGHVNDMKDIDPSHLFDLRIPLYQGDSALVCFSEWMPGDFWRREQSTAQSRLRCERTVKLDDPRQIAECDAETILVETSLELQLEHAREFWRVMMTEVYKKNFVLNSRWYRIYLNLPSFDWGVSVRRGNFLAYHPEADQGAEAIAEKINALSGQKVIFSDDQAFQMELRKLTGSPFGLGEIDSGLIGVDNYFCQFLTLSKCRRILGTAGSSFPEQASVFGGTLYKPL